MNQQGIKILLIDDDDVSLFLCSEILRIYFNVVGTTEYEIHLAHGADEITEKIVYLRENIDVVVTRKNLPQTSGKLICQIIKNMNPRTKVFAVSTSPVVDEEIECLKEGFDGYLSKPINKEQFLRTILS